MLRIYMEPKNTDKVDSIESKFDCIWMAVVSFVGMFIVVGQWL